MVHRTFGGLDDAALLDFFLEHREATAFECRRQAHLAWSVLCARQLERMRAYIVLFRRRHGHHDVTPEFDNAVLRTAVERVLAAGSGFEGSTLREFRAMVRERSRRACAEALAKGSR